MPGKVACFLRAAELDDTERAVLDRGVTVRRRQGYTLRVSAVPTVHRQLLVRCQPLDGGQGVPALPAQRKARREYEDRITTRLRQAAGAAGPLPTTPISRAMQSAGTGPFATAPQLATWTAKTAV